MNSFMAPNAAEVAGALHANGAAVDAPRRGGSPGKGGPGAAAMMVVACSAGAGQPGVGIPRDLDARLTPLVVRLLAAGADANVRDAIGSAAAFYAVASARPRALRALLGRRRQPPPRAHRRAPLPR
jgi:hypothetical protein